MSVSEVNKQAQKAPQGWFLSYSEEPKNDEREQRNRLVIYTRLCYNIGSRIASLHQTPQVIYYPAKTHILSVGYYTALVTGTDESGNEEIMRTEGTSTAISSSLPANTGPMAHDGIGAKERNRQLRELTALNTPGLHPQITVDINSGKFERWGAWNCAEAPNFLA